MDKEIQMNIAGIKCDTTDCDYKDDSVQMEDYKDWLNKPCPICGGNLLTEADYNNVQQIITFVNMVNGGLPPADPSEKKVKLTVDMDGTGNVSMKVDELKK